MKHTPTPTSSGAEQARRRLPAILDDAAHGRTTVITRRGHEVAAVVPVASARLAAPMPLTALAGSGRGLWGGDGARAVAELREEWSR